VSPNLSAVAAMSRSGIDGARWCPDWASNLRTSHALSSIAGASSSTRILDKGRDVNALSRSGADRAEYPISSRVMDEIRTLPASIRDAQVFALGESLSRTKADLSINHPAIATRYSSRFHLLNLARV